MRLHEALRRSRGTISSLTVAAVFAAVMIAVPASAVQQASLPTGPVQGGIIDRVLVRIDGQAILHSEFEARWTDQLSVIAGQFSQEQIDAQAAMIRLGLMQALAEGIMLELRAEDLGIVADVNDIDRAIQNMRETNALTDDAAWAAALATNGITEALLREQAESSIVQQRMMMQEISRKVFVSSIEIENYYTENQAQFTDPEQVLFQQIIFVYTGADRAGVRERADNALSELRAGISLTAVGSKYAQAGDLVQDASKAAWIAPEDLQPEILVVVNDLTPLDYSDVIEGKFGYLIVQLMDRKEGSIASLEAVGTQIDAFLRDQKMGVELDSYTGELMQHANIVIYAEEFVELKAVWLEGDQGAPTGTPGRGR